MLLNFWNILIGSKDMTFVQQYERLSHCVPPAQNPHQTVTFWGCIITWWTSCGLVSSHIRQFCLLTQPFIQKCASSLKMFFRRIYAEESIEKNNFVNTSHTACFIPFQHLPALIEKPFISCPYIAVIGPIGRMTAIWYS